MVSGTAMSGNEKGHIMVGRVVKINPNVTFVIWDMDHLNPNLISYYYYYYYYYYY